MMEDEAELAARRNRAAQVARAILSGELGIVDGVRKLLPIVTRLPEYNVRRFLAIISIESQTDDVPLGKERESVPKAELERFDREMADFLPKVRDDLMEACRQIVERYG